MRTVFSFRLLLVGAAFFLLQACMSYEDVEFKNVQRVNFNKVSKDELRITLGVTLNNPNNYKIKVVKSDLALTIGGVDAGKAKLKQKVILKKKNESVYDVIIEADPKAIGKAALASGISMAITGKVNVGVKGWIKGRVFIFGKKFDVEFKQQVDMKDLKND